ncbi:MAG TPA: hypothetical protein VGF95_04120 [Solirubrobacteraceae bacterium]|jgi:hypothetical protein
MTGQKQTPFVIHLGTPEEVRGHFDERFPSIEFRPLAFNLDRVALALFSSTYRSPITLLFPKENAYKTNLTSDIAMTVELAQAMYHRDEDNDSVVAAYETPSWYVRGMASFTDRLGMSHTVPMHACLNVAEERDPESATVQIDCDPTLFTTGE